MLGINYDGFMYLGDGGNNNLDFGTTPIQDFFQDDGGLYVLTKNREYRFDNI